MEGWLDAQQARPARPQGRWTAAQAAHDLLQPEDALDPGLLRALDLRLRHPDRRPGPGAHPGGAAQVAAHRQGHEDHLVVQLGRRPRRLPGHPGQRPDAEEDRGQGEVRVRADLHVLPAPHLRALPQPVVRRVLSQRRHLQAVRGRHRARRPGPLPRLADVHLGLPLQEGLLQPPHRQGGEVHVLLPAHRGGASHGLLRDLRRPAPLHRPDAVRRRQGPGRRSHHGRARPRPGSARGLPRSARPGGPAGGGAGGDPPGLGDRGPALADLRADQPFQGGAAAAPGVPHDADGLVHPAAVAGRRRGQGHRLRRRGQGQPVRRNRRAPDPRSSTSPNRSPPARWRPSTGC